MNFTEKQFLSLLRSGLTGTVPDPALFAGTVGWEDIYRLADEQTVVPVVTDGIDLLPSALKPGIEILEPFLADTLATEMRNDTVNRFAGALFRKLNSTGMPALMVKGQGLARLYPQPGHRQPGDIDILVRPEDYPAVRDLLVAKASVADQEHAEILHQGMSFGSIEVEVHGTISTLMSVRLDRKLAALQEEMFRSEAFTSEDFGGVTVRMPSVLFNAVYILIHFLHHYWSGGVGLRQLTDWGLYVNRHFDEIDAGRLEGVLRDLGVLRLWQTFSGLSTTVLGTDKDRFPLWTDRYHRKYEGILRYMLKCGNFGMNHPREAVERPYLLRKIHSFWRLVVADRLRHFPEFPAESVRYFTGAFHYGLIRLAEGE